MAEAAVVEKELPKLRLRDTAPWWPLLVWLGPCCGLLLFSIFPLAMIALTYLFPPGLYDSLPGYLHFGVMLLMMGSLPMQGTLIGLCWGLGTGTFWQRTFGVLVTAMAAFQCVLLGYLASALWQWLFLLTENVEFPDATRFLTADLLWRVSLLSGCALPLLLIGFQFPFSVMRIAFHWRLARVIANDAKRGAAPPDEPLSIRDLLLGTALLAVSIAIAQFEDRNLQAQAQTPQSYLFEVFTMVAIVAVVVTITILPLAAVSVRQFNLPTAWFVGSLVVLVIVVGYIGVTILTSDNFTLDGLAMGGTLVVIYYSGVASGLTLLRIYGWRLNREKQVAA